MKIFKDKRVKILENKVFNDKQIIAFSSGKKGVESRIFIPPLNNDKLVVTSVTKNLDEETVKLLKKNGYEVQILKGEKFE